MFDTAAHLVDAVLPHAPYRQWVLSFPSVLRLRLAYESTFFEAARGIVVASVFNWQRRAARRLGLKKPLVGAVSFAQRFASSLFLWPHLHLVVPDGVFQLQPDGSVAFHPLPRPTVEDLAHIAARIARRVARWLERHALPEEPRDALAATFAAATAPSRASNNALEPRLCKLAALVEGFSLEAGRHVHAHDREALERLCRYGTRPPFALERLSRTDEGQLVLRFKKARDDGATGVTFSPLEFMRRLAALVPPPGFHATSYHGVFASRAKVRAQVVPPPSVPSPEAPSDAPPPPDSATAERSLCWAELLFRTRGVDVLRCLKCGGRMKLIAFITEPNLARDILQRLGLAPPA
jgi:hypothetical protein